MWDFSNGQFCPGASCWVGRDFVRSVSWSYGFPCTILLPPPFFSQMLQSSKTLALLTPSQPLLPKESNLQHEVCINLLCFCFCFCFLFLETVYPLYPCWRLKEDFFFFFNRNHPFFTFTLFWWWHKLSGFLEVRYWFKCTLLVGRVSSSAPSLTFLT